MHGTWWIFTAILAAGLASLAWRGVVQARSVVDDPRGAGGEAAIVLALFAGAWLIRGLVPQNVHYTYNDEYLYMRHATELAQTGKFSFASQPPLLIYLYARAFELFESSSSVTFAVTALLGSLTPPALYWFLRGLGVDRAVAIVSSVLLVLHPLHVKHSGASSLEVASLLAILLTLGSLVRWLTDPSASRLLCFAASLFAALTVRVENFALLALFVPIVFLWRDEREPAPRWQWVTLAVCVVIAAVYVPSVLSFHGEQDVWWKSRLPALALLWNNLLFWIGGSFGSGVLAALLVTGIVCALRRNPRAAVLFLLLLLLYSAIYVVHGVNLGYLEEAHQPRSFAVRARGHDMFRFNVVLLPASLYFLGSGLVVWARLVRKATSGRIALGVLLLVAIVAAVVEARRFDPIGFLRSPYNRSFEVAEYRFLEDAFARIPGHVLGYMLRSPLEPFLGERIEIVQFEDPSEIDARDDETFLYLNTLQLGAERMQEQLGEIGRRFEVSEVARAPYGAGELFLYRLRARDAG